MGHFPTCQSTLTSPGGLEPKGSMRRVGQALSNWACGCRRCPASLCALWWGASRPDPSTFSHGHPTLTQPALPPCPSTQPRSAWPPSTRCCTAPWAARSPARPRPPELIKTGRRQARQPKPPHECMATAAHHTTPLGAQRGRPAVQTRCCTARQVAPQVAPQPPAAACRASARPVCCAALSA